MKDFEPALLEMLSSEIATKRLAATVVIAEVALGTEPILDALRALTESEKDTRVRQWVAEAFGAIGPKTIISDLGPLLSDTSREVKTAVKNVLARSESVTEDDMIEMLETGDARAKRSSIAVLGAMATHRSYTILLERIRGANNKTVTSIVNAVRPGLTDGDADTCTHIVSEINRLLRVKENLDDPEFSMVAAQLLSHGASFGALDVLVKLSLQSKDKHVQVYALESIQKIAKGKHPKVFEQLLNIAEDEDLADEVRMAGLNALENLEIPMTIDARVRGLTTKSVPAIRQWSIRALGGTDSAPNAEALASVVCDGVADDRELALAAMMRTSNGKVAAAKLLGSLTELDRAEQVARALRKFEGDFAPEIRNTLEKSVTESTPEIGQIIFGLLKRSGGGAAENIEKELFEKATLLSNKRKYDEAATLLKTMCQGDSVAAEIRFLLGVCELKLSKRKITRGPNHDPCLTTFQGLMSEKEFDVLKSLTSDKILEDEDLFYLGFSMTERSELEKSLGGDLLLHIMESSKDKQLSARAENKLKTMGWIE